MFCDSSSSARFLSVMSRTMKATAGRFSIPTPSRPVRPSNHRSPACTSSEYSIIWLAPVSSVPRTSCRCVSADGPGQDVVKPPSLHLSRRAIQQLFLRRQDFEISAVFIDDEHEIGQRADDGGEPVLAARQLRGPFCDAIFQFGGMTSRVAGARWRSVTSR